MQVLFIGILIQISVLLSTYYVFRRSAEATPAPDTCAKGRRGAKRAVLFLSHGFTLEANKAIANTSFEPTLLQNDGFNALTSGLEEHPVFSGAHASIDSVLGRADGLVYVGPQGLLEGVARANTVIGITYPKKWTRLSEDVKRNDEFVINTIGGIFKSAKDNGTLGCILKKKLVILLYLTSVDLVSLKHPASMSERRVEEMKLRMRISSVQSMIEGYYQDEETVYLATSDRRLRQESSEWLMVWGRGTGSGMGPPMRLVDACPLIASLLGLPVPLQSSGWLPGALVNMSTEETAIAYACNALQRYQRAFTARALGDHPAVRSLYDLIKEKRYAEILQASRELLSLSDFRYHESRLVNKTNFELSLIFAAFIALVGWILVLITDIMIGDTGDLQPSKFLKFSLGIIAALVSAVTICLTVFPSPLQYKPNFFYLIPLHPVFDIILKYKIIYTWMVKQFDLKTLLFRGLGIICLVEVLSHVLEGGYALTIAIALVVQFPLLSTFRSTPYIYSIWWFTVSAVSIGMYNFPTRLFGSVTRIINFSATLWLSVCGTSAFLFDGRKDKIVSLVLVVMITFATVLGNGSEVLHSLSSTFYLVSRVLLLTVLIPFAGSKRLPERLVHMILSFAVPLILLSKGLESSLYMVMSMYVATWAFLERSNASKRNDPWSDLRRGMFLCFALILAYLFMGKLNTGKLYNESILTTFMPSYSFVYYYSFIGLRYLLALVTVLVIYNSMVKYKVRKDYGFYYALLIMEVLCLKFFILFLWPGQNRNETLFKHLFINVFTIAIQVSYIVSRLYIAPYIKTQSSAHFNFLHEQGDVPQ